MHSTEIMVTRGWRAGSGASTSAARGPVRTASPVAHPVWLRFVTVMRTGRTTTDGGRSDDEVTAPRRELPGPFC